MTLPHDELGGIGRVLTAAGVGVGTCFQVAPGVLVTCAHVTRDAGADGVGSTVRISALDGTGARLAVVRKVDDSHDLAVLVTAQPLPVSMAWLAATSRLTPGTDVGVTGLADVPHAEQIGWSSTDGRWQGPAGDGEVVVSKVRAPGLMKGMSGAPVVRTSDGAVVGVVRSRYNSLDEWGLHSVTVARIEDLVPLLADVAPGVGIRPELRPLAAPPAVVWRSALDGQVRRDGSPAIEVHLVPVAPVTPLSQAELRATPAAFAKEGSAMGVFGTGEDLLVRINEDAVLVASRRPGGVPGAAITRLGQRSAWLPVPDRHGLAVAHEEELTALISVLLEFLLAIPVPRENWPAVAVGLEPAQTVAAYDPDGPRLGKASPRCVRSIPEYAWDWSALDDHRPQIGAELAARIVAAHRRAAQLG